LRAESALDSAVGLRGLAGERGIRGRRAEEALVSCWGLVKMMIEGAGLLLPLLLLLAGWLGLAGCHVYMPRRWYHSGGSTFWPLGSPLHFRFLVQTEDGGFPMSSTMTIEGSCPSDSFRYPLDLPDI